MLNESDVGIYHVAGGSSFPSCPTSGAGHFWRGSEGHPILPGAGALQGILAASKATTTH